MTIDGPRQAELVVVSTHAYFWMEVGLAADREGLAEAAAQLDTIYNQLTEPFGQEQRPGIDQDDHLHVLHYLARPMWSSWAILMRVINTPPRSFFPPTNER